MMGGFKIKNICLLVCLSVVGCTSYKLPVETENHPAFSNTEITQIQLSPILDLDENNPDVEGDVEKDD